MKIKKTNGEFKVIDISLEDGLKLTNRIGSITIYDDPLKEKIIEQRFAKRYRNLLYLVMNLDSEEGEDSDLVRSKIQELRNILLNNYSKHISKNTLNHYLKMLLLLEEKIRGKEKHRGR